MSARKAISKRTRFEVFKRDGFTCQYCGAAPPNVVLEVDHIEPVAAGGDNDEGNLVTACFGCNRGKAALSLNVVPESLSERAERVREAEAQLAGYRAAMRDLEDRKEDDAWQIIDALYSATTTTRERLQSVKSFLLKLDFEDVLDAANTTRGNVPYLSDGRLFKYFCAVCWRKIGAKE